MLTRLENKHWQDVEHQTGCSMWSAYLLLRPFLSENLTDRQQRSMVSFLGSSTDTMVQSLSLATDPELPNVHIALETEGKTSEEALSSSVVGVLGAFTMAEIDPQTVDLVTAHIAHHEWLAEDRLVDPTLLISDERYRLPDKDAQDVYVDEQANYAHLLSFFSRTPQ